MKKLKIPRFELFLLLFGVFLVSFSVLSFEISLTRVFSVMFSYHYTFVAVSLALLGLSMGGALSHLLSETSLEKTFSILALISLIFSFTASILTFVMVSITASSIVGAIFLQFIPFFIAGVLLALVYKMFVGKSNILYFTDLAGAAIAALATVFLLNFAGALKALILIGTMPLAASLLFAFASKKKTIAYAVIIGAILLAFFAQQSLNNNLSGINPGSNQEKELSLLLTEYQDGAKIINTRSSAFGQTDLVEMEAEPHYKVIFVDGGAGTRMFHFDGNFSSSDTYVPLLEYTTQYFPYYLAMKGSSLIIGPGGGLDVLTSMMSGMNHTTAVEVNPDIVDIVRDYSEYNGGIYSNYSNVHVYVDEGRSFVRRSDQKYDIIMLNIPITKTSQSSMGYALAENYLFTVNSFKDFLNILNDEGLIAVVAHDQLEVYRLMSIAFRLFEEQGLDSEEIMRHIMIIGDLQSHHLSRPVLILKKTPFTNQLASVIYEQAIGAGLMPIHVPSVYTLDDPILVALANGKTTMDLVVSSIPSDITPPTDNNPFFYKFEKGIPLTLFQLLIGAAILGTITAGTYMGIWVRQLWRSRTGKKWHSDIINHSPFRLYYFASLGLGFMFIEIPLIQSLILFLGHPTFAIATVLFSLLLAGGLGSFYSRKWKSHNRYDVFNVTLVIGIISLIYLLALPFLLNLGIDYDSTIRFLISFALIFPIGFLLGIPFPTGLRITGKKSGNDAAWMWCINGMFSVLGSVMALVLAMSFGFSSVFLSGAAIYGMLFLVGRIWTRKKIKTANRLLHLAHN